MIKGSRGTHSPGSRVFSLASVPLINSWLSSVTNVSLPSSSPGEEGGVFNVQFVLWIDVCWHRLSPFARTVRNPSYHYQNAFSSFLRAHFYHRTLENNNSWSAWTLWMTDTRRSTYKALMDKSGWWKETTRSPGEEEEEEGEQRGTLLKHLLFALKTIPSWILFFFLFFKKTHRATRGEIDLHTLRALCSVCVSVYAWTIIQTAFRFHLDTVSELRLQKEKEKQKCHGGSSRLPNGLRVSDKTRSLLTRVGICFSFLFFFLVLNRF